MIIINKHLLSLVTLSVKTNNQRLVLCYFCYKYILPISHFFPLKIRKEYKMFMQSINCIIILMVPF